MLSRHVFRKHALQSHQAFALDSEEPAQRERPRPLSGTGPRGVPQSLLLGGPTVGTSETYTFEEAMAEKWFLSNIFQI